MTSQALCQRGYGYQQVTDDFGANPILGGFRSRVVGIGPQFGCLFQVGDMQGYLDLNAYSEFAAGNWASGRNTRLLHFTDGARECGGADGPDGGEVA